MQKYKSILLVLLLLSALVLVACGGDDEEPTEEPTIEAIEEEPTEAEALEATEEVIDEETEEAPEATEEIVEETEEVAEEEETAEATEEMVEGEETPEGTAEAEAGTIVDEAVVAEFAILVTAIDAADLTESLSGEGPFTVFAPTDEAFEAAFDDLDMSLQTLMDDTELLTSILQYHVVSGEVTADSLAELDGQEVETLQGDTISVSVDEDGNVVLNDNVSVVATDLVASNGVIHVIDAVLIPPSADVEGTGGAAGVAEETEEMVTEETEEATVEAEETEMADEDVTIAVVVMERAEAEDDPEFTSLQEAIVASGTVSGLLGEDGPFTLFAPTDEAFDEFPAEVMDALLNSTISVQSTLSYHVVEGIYTSEDLADMDGEALETLLPGSTIMITVDEDGTIFVNDNEIVESDIEASNGVIHVIEGVLLPEMPEGAPDLEGMGEATEEAMAEETEEAMVEAEETEEMVEEETEEPVTEATEEEPGEAVTAATGGPGSITNVCLVTDQGGVDDGTFNQLAFEGMQRAAEDFGLETQTIESDTPSDFEPNIRTCLDSEYDAIITVGFLLTDATLDAAEANPDVYFIGVDQFFADHPTNLVGVQYREDQPGFVVGVMAAMMTESDVIGGVYGIDVPAVVKFRNGFEQGAKYVNPDITVLGSYSDSFIDPTGGAETAQAMLGDGADVIFGAGGQTGTGGITYAAAEGAWVIGVDQDEYFTSFGAGESPGADRLITSATKAVDVGVYNLLDALTEGNIEWPGGDIYILEASNQGVGFAPPHDADVPEEVTERAEEVLQMLAEGELETGVDPLTGALLDEDEPSTDDLDDATEEADEDMDETDEAEATEEASD